MNRCVEILIRLAIELLGVFMILFATAEIFDANELASLVGIAALLLTVEVSIVTTHRKSNDNACPLSRAQCRAG